LRLRTHRLLGCGLCFDHQGWRLLPGAGLLAQAAERPRPDSNQAEKAHKARSNAEPLADVCTLAECDHDSRTQLERFGLARNQMI